MGINILKFDFQGPEDGMFAGIHCCQLFACAPAQELQHLAPGWAESTVGTPDFNQTRLSCLIHPRDVHLTVISGA